MLYLCSEDWGFTYMACNAGSFPLCGIVPAVCPNHSAGAFILRVIGMSIRSESKSRYPRLYQVWKGMRARCNNPHHVAYMNYGGRGIYICDEWNDFSNFAKWAYMNGYDENAPQGVCTLDRINVNGNYEPDNCRFSNATEQNLNQRDTEFLKYDGKEMTICQWADYLGINRSVLIQRRLRGWSIEKVLSTPVGAADRWEKTRKPIICLETGEIFKSIEEAASHVGVSSSNISMVIRKHNRTAGGYHWRLIQDI